MLLVMKLQETVTAFGDGYILEVSRTSYEAVLREIMLEIDFYPEQVGVKLVKQRRTNKDIDRYCHF